MVLVLTAVVPSWARVGLEWVAEGIQTMPPPPAFRTWIAPTTRTAVVADTTATWARITGGLGYDAWLLGVRIRELPGTSMPAGVGLEIGDRTRLLVGLPDLNLAGSPASLYLRLYRRHDRLYDSFTYHDDDIATILSRRLGREGPSTVSLGLAWRRQSYSDFAPGYDSSNPSFAPSSFLELSATYLRDTRDLLHQASKGSVLSYALSANARSTGDRVQYHRHDLAAETFRSWGSAVVALRGRWTALDGFTAYDDKRISFWDRLTGGGEEWGERGYEDDAIGPRDVFGRNFGGVSEFALNAEYRVKVPRRSAYLVLFADGFNVWEKVSETDPVHLKRAIGFGLDLLTEPLGIIRVHCAYGLDRRGEDGDAASLRIHITPWTDPFESQPTKLYGAPHWW